MYCGRSKILRSVTVRAGQLSVDLGWVAGGNDDDDVVGVIMAVLTQFYEKMLMSSAFES